MSIQTQEAIQNIINTLQTYTMSVQGYNELAYSHSDSWEQQREAYEHWVNLHVAYSQYMNDVNQLAATFTDEISIPVNPGSYVGIGILGVGVIYLMAPVDVVEYPFKQTVGMNMLPALELFVGGLPEGSIIYTLGATYTIQQGQAVNLTVG